MLPELAELAGLADLAGLAGQGCLRSSAAAPSPHFPLRSTYISIARGRLYHFFFRNSLLIFFLLSKPGQQEGYD